MSKNIDWYGENDNYIHLKFGDARKMYNFTKEFMEKYPKFCEEYMKYFNMERSRFNSPFAIVSYVYKHEMPVYFYYNFTDTPANDLDEILEYLVNENTCPPELFDFAANADVEEVTV